jgi:GNAT superfamily N-acetyltransferase
MEIVEVDLSSPEAGRLVSALDTELRELYPDLTIHGIEPVEFRRIGGVFLLARVQGTPVACGALRPLGNAIAEIRRMFVEKKSRGQGISRAMLAALEEIARNRGYRAIRLETGVNQPAAIHLYETAGYRPIACYGADDPDPESRYFEKSLPASLPGEEEP